MKWILRYLKGISDTSICYDSQNLGFLVFGMQILHLIRIKENLLLFTCSLQPEVQ